MGRHPERVERVEGSLLSSRCKIDRAQYVLIFMRRRPCYVYILASRSRVLYIGVTSSLRGRLGQHDEGTHGSFTKRYRVRRLVYVEEHDDIEDAIARERQLKKWRREKKVRLIESQNPDWIDWSREPP